MATLELLTAEVKADSDFSCHDDYGCRTFGRVRYFSGSMLCCNSWAYFSARMDFLRHSLS